MSSSFSRRKIRCSVTNQTSFSYGFGKTAWQAPNDHDGGPVFPCVIRGGLVFPQRVPGKREILDKMVTENKSARTRTNGKPCERESSVRNADCMILSGDTMKIAIKTTRVGARNHEWLFSVRNAENAIAERDFGGTHGCSLATELNFSPF